MTGKGKPPAKSPMQVSREKRLAEALRANLKRRKAAKRGIAGETGAPAETGGGAETKDPKR